MTHSVTVGQRYRHFKTGNEYEIVGIARHTENLEEMVVYRGLYNSPDFGPNPLWVRPLSMFVEEVERDGVRVPRFALVG